MELIEDDTLCEFFLLINKLQHMVHRNVRFADITTETNIHSLECRSGLISLGLVSPWSVLWRMLEVLSVAGLLTYEEHGNFESELSIGALIGVWESLSTVCLLKVA